MKVSSIVVIILVFFASLAITAQETPLMVVTTTSIIADVAENVGGELVNVTAIVPRNSDVHAFQPAPADIVLVTEADVIFVNGAGLEETLEQLLDDSAVVEPIVVSHGIAMLPFAEGEHDHAEETEEEEILGILGEEGVCEDAHDAEHDHDDEHDEAEEEHDDHDHEEEHEHGSCDPHVWTSVENVKIWTENITSALTEADPANAEIYRANADAYLEQLDALSGELEELIASVPEEKRVLVTNHEFMGYYAHEYGFEIVGTVIAGGTSLSEPSPQDIAGLIELIHEEGVPAIFAEISSDNRLAEVISQEAGVAVVVDLYSDSLSEVDEPASTYLDYMRFNTQTIVTALTG